MDEVIMLKKNGKIKHYIAVIVYIVLGVLDMTLTYIATPDLRFEGNPLVTIFGLGWAALLIVNFLTFLLFAFLAYYTFVKYERKMIACENFKQFCSMLFFNRPDKFHWLFMKLPKKGRFAPYFAMAGYFLTVVMFAMRIIVIVEWTVIIATWGGNLQYTYWYTGSALMTWYMDFRLLTAGVAMGILAILYWLIREYQINKKILGNAVQDKC
jgi:hypothetical protein